MDSWEVEQPVRSYRPLGVPDGADWIRCSSLDTWVDCPRRWLAQHRRKLLESAGYLLGERSPSIGAPVGTASHAGVALSWEGLAEGDDWGPLDAADDAAVQALRERVEQDGVVYDDTTPSMNDAELAARKIIRAYRQHTLKNRKPLGVEQELIGQVRVGLYLTGHTDLFVEELPDIVRVEGPDLVIDDLKTGVSRPAPVRQLGAYVWLKRAQGGRRPNKARMTYVRRVRRSTEQPPPLPIPFDAEVAVEAARQTVKEISKVLQDIEISGEVNLREVRANPASPLCGARYCQAFHTGLCRESFIKPAKD